MNASQIDLEEVNSLFDKLHEFTKKLVAMGPELHNPKIWNQKRDEVIDITKGIVSLSRHLLGKINDHKK